MYRVHVKYHLTLKSVVSTIDSFPLCLISVASGNSAGSTA